MYFELDNDEMELLKSRSLFISLIFILKFQYWSGIWALLRIADLDVSSRNKARIPTDFKRRRLANVACANCSTYKLSNLWR